MSDCSEYVNKIGEQIIEIARLRTLVKELMGTLELARDYLVAEYSDGDIGDGRPDRGEYETLDTAHDAVHTALAKARGEA